jgi:hypothetical protein
MIVLHNTASLRVYLETFVSVRSALWRLAPIMFVLLLLAVHYLALFMCASFNAAPDISAQFIFE